MNVLLPWLQVLPLEEYRDRLAAYWRVGYHDNINQIEEILLGETKAYVFFRCVTDSRSYVIHVVT